MKYDFSGWATRNDLLCSDGRTIRKDAFKHNDGETVPLVWNHNHSATDNVLGHALLENRDEGVYAYCSFNDTESGNRAKKLVQHGDVRSLSIYANKLKQSGMDVIHGAICEVSLVLAGANPGAFIDSVMAHGEDTESGIILGYDENIVIYHSDEADKKDEDGKVETVEDVFNTLTEKQKDAVYSMFTDFIESNNEENKETDDEEIKEEKDDLEGGKETMKHNVFDNEDNQNNVLSHSDMEKFTNEVISDAKRYGSIRDSFLAHSQNYGIEHIDYLFPDAKSVSNQPEFIKRNTDWVSKVMKEVHRTPFSKIKSQFADITADEARAKGYTKGKKKIDEVFTLLKRTTNSTTIYKKQKLDRDDVVDITDFDVIAWIKSEMRTMLDEEIARAILVGDGRSTASDDKINESSIRPIWTDDDLYSVKHLTELETNATEDDEARAFIKAIIKSRKEYKGSGNPTLFTTEDMIAKCLLLEDTTGRVIYDTEEKLRTALRVEEIVAVEPMEGAKRTDSSVVKYLDGILVNLKDYNVGADKGGEVNMFDDFDIDYNQMKYLIETRCSGALIRPKSAIIIEHSVKSTTTPTNPSGDDN